MSTRLTFVFLLLFSCFLSRAQDKYSMRYEDLKKYEGRYEYIGGSTLEIAASPKDLILFAIIDDARYALTPSQKDVFLNPAKQAVNFIRDNQQNITGYTAVSEAPGKLFRLLTRNTSFPEEMWYPRKPGAVYKYEPPKNIPDGIFTGSLQGTGLDSTALVEMVGKIADGTLPNVHSVLILKDGKLVFEEYFYEYGMDTQQQIRSATKSFVSTLIGIAIEKGLIKNIQQPVLSFFPSYAPADLTGNKKKITIENMLNNQSGLACNDHDAASPGNESKMYPTGDWIKFVLDLPLVDTPGTKGSYCSGNVMVLSKIIEKVSGKSLYQFAKENLFDPIGAAGYKWNFKTDSSEQNNFGQLFIRPRDMAKFGLLFLNKGKWKNAQVVPENWVKEVLLPHSTIDNTPYGYLWWHPWLTVNGIRNDATAARGNGGQRIYLRPDLNMVVIITGGNYNSESGSDKILARYILPAFNKKTD